MKILRKSLIGLAILIFLNISLIPQIDADELKGRFGIGVGNPYLSIKYGFDSKSLWEIRGAYGSDILVGGFRNYYYFNPKDRLVIYLAGEGDYVDFKGENSSGYGLIGGLFVGAESFISSNVTLNFDIGPAYIRLYDKASRQSDSWVEGITCVVNLGINRYFSGKKEGDSSYKTSLSDRSKKQEPPPVQTTSSPKPESKVEPEIAFPSPPKPIFEKANLIVKEDTALYSGPSAIYSVITRLNRETKLLLLDDANFAYYKVKLPDGTVGWVLSVLVKRF